MKRGIVFILLILAVVGLIFYWFTFRPGTLEIKITPKDAIIKINDEIKPRLESGKYYLEAGTYKLRLESQGYIDWEQEVTVSASRNKKVEVTLKSIPSPIKLTQEKVKSVQLSTDDQWLYFLDEKGETVYRQELLGNQANLYSKEPVTSGRLNNLSEFFLNGDLGLFHYPNKTTLFDFQKFDLTNQTEKEFPEGTNFAAFSPSGNRLAIAVEKDDYKAILITDLMFNTQRSIETRILTSPLKLFWGASEERLAVIDKNGRLAIADIFSKDLIPLSLGGELALEALPAPKTDQVAIEVTNKKGNRLYILDLKFPKLLPYYQRTNAAKSVWMEDGRNLIIAKPNGNNESDDLFIWDLDKNQLSKLFWQSNSALSFFNLNLNQANDLLFFRDREGFLYQLRVERGTYPYAR